MTTSTGEWTFRRDRAESQVVYTSISSNQQGAIREENSIAEDMDTSTLPYGSQMSAPIISPFGTAESLYPAIPDAVNTVHIIESDNHIREDGTTKPSEVMEEQSEAGLKFAQQYLKDGAEIVSDKEIELATASSQTPTWTHINTNAEAMAAAEQLSRSVTSELPSQAKASVAPEQPFFPQTETSVRATSPFQPHNDETPDDTDSATASPDSDRRSEGTEALARDLPMTRASLHQQHLTETLKAPERQPVGPFGGSDAVQPTLADQEGRPRRTKRKRASEQDEEEAREKTLMPSAIQRQPTLALAKEKIKTRADSFLRRRAKDRGLSMSPDPPTTTALSSQPKTPSPPQRFPTSSTTTAASQDENPTILRRRSRRSTPIRYKAEAPIVFCSSGVESIKKNKVRTTLEQLGGTLASGIANATLYCIADKPLVKTCGLILAIALSKEVVTERWLIDMNRNDKFPDPKNYLPSDRKHEAEWLFKLEDAIQRGKDGLNTMLSAYDIQCTPRLKLELTEKKHYKDFAQIATVLGAKHVRAGWPPAACASENLIVLGAKHDPHAAAVGRSGHQLYDKDLITMAALRGKLELNSDEFSMIVVKKEGSD